MDRISIKCRNLSVIAIACVVAIHSNSLVAESNSPRWMQVLCDVLFGKLTCWAVPFFFAASGYWFGAKECVEGKTFRLRQFYQKKLKTLVVPYVFFVLLGLATSIPLAYMQGVKHGDGMFAHMSLTWDVLGITELLPYGNGPMWYLRSLIMLFMLAPLWRLLAVGTKWLLFPMACLAMFSPPLIVEGMIPFRLGQSSFFFLGLLLSRFHVLSTRTRFRSVVVFALVAGAMIAHAECVAGFGVAVSGFLPYVMLALVWTSYDIIASAEVARPNWLSHYVFWIFGVHIIFLNWLLPPFRAIIRLPWMSFAMTWFSGAMAFALAVFSAMIAEKANHGLYSTLSGGR